jgi:peptidoglycan hydrolase-like protein with peptidoglycan-binding domain
MADGASIEYWKDAALNLYFKDIKDCSLDDDGAKKYKKKATVPGKPVTDLQKDLIALGYLEAGSADGYYSRGCARAVTRFQRHAGKVYRIGQDKKPCDAQSSEAYSGSVDGICNQATAVEIRKWLDKKWILPCGRFKIKEKKRIGATGTMIPVF